MWPWSEIARLKAAITRADSVNYRNEADLERAEDNLALAKSGITDLTAELKAVRAKELKARNDLASLKGKLQAAEHALQEAQKNDTRDMRTGRYTKAAK